jgi:uncharacterized protein (DUF2147 family)
MEVVMKRVLAVAVLLVASSTAQAQYEFQYGGHTIRIDPDRGIVSIPGIYDNTPKKSKKTQDNQHKQAPQDAAIEPQPPQPAAPAAGQPATAAPAPVANAPAPAAPSSTAAPPPQPSTTTATVAPADTAAAAPPPPSPAPQVQQAAPSPATPQAAGTVAAVPPPSAPVAPAPSAVPPPSAPVAPAPSAVQQRPQVAAPARVRDPNSPVGVWLTEEKEGKVRIVSCGSNLCGYSVDAKTNLNGEQVLINMKPSPGQKWTGRIHDPNTGSNYDSTIALKGGDTLRVQGCAFGGMFCGGQTWTRVD